MHAVSPFDPPNIHRTNVDIREHWKYGSQPEIASYGFPVTERHRLTITITMSLYRELCELAGPRRLSAWMEDAAWRKIRTLRGEGPPPGARGAPATPPISRLPSLPPPPWCWSPLRPPQITESSEDLVDL